MADGKIRIDTTLETKSAAKSFKDLESMARRVGKNLQNAMKGGDAKELEKQLKEQQKLIQQTQKEIDKYQSRLDGIDSSKAVASLQNKIAAENEIVSNAKSELEKYAKELEAVDQKIIEMKGKAAEQVRSEYSPEMLAANPKLEGYETKKTLSSDVDYQAAIEQENELHAKMAKYESKVNDATQSASALKDQLHNVKAEQESILEEKISTLSKTMVNAKDKASTLAEMLEKVKRKSDMSVPTKKTSSAFESSSNDAKSLGNHISGAAEKGIKKITRLVMAVFSIRSAFMIAKKAASTYLQSNEQLAGQVQGIWNALAQAVGPIVQMIVGWMVQLVSYINAFIKALTGIDFVAKGNAAALDKQAESAGNVAKETKKANTQLMAFDELNVMSSNDANDTGSGGSGTSVPQLELDPVNIDDIKAKFLELLEPMRNAWDNYGQGFIDSFKYGLNEVWGLTKAIGRSINEVWMNGTGELTCSLILLILTNIFNTIGNIAKRFREAWEAAGVGTQIIQNIWDVVNILLGGVNDITKSFEKWTNSLDFKPLLKSIEKLTAKLKPLADLIVGNLKWAFDKVLLPLGKWVIEDAGPVAIEALAEALDFLSSICKAGAETFQRIWDVFFEPIADWAGDAIVTVLEDLALVFEWLSEQSGLCEFLGGLNETLGALVIAVTAVNVAMSLSPITWIILGITALIVIIVECIKHWDEIKEAAVNCWDWICEKWGQAVEFFSGLWDGICEVFNGIGDWFKEKFQAAYDIICGIFADIGKWFSDRYDDIKGVLSSVGSWFTDKFTSAWEGIKKAFSGVKNFFAGVWKGICDVFGNIAGWFKNKFSAAWQAVKDVFSTGGKVFDGIKDGILNGLKSVINALIDGINRVIKIPFDGINWALQEIKDISILGAHPFDWISTIDVPQIPKLAKGGIVNRPTLSMIGEAGKEAVMPLENNTGWIAQLADQINSYGSQDQSTIISLLRQLIEVVERKELQIGDREIGEACQRHNGRKGFSFGTI